MSKVYILAICLLAASFTGCLSDDTSESIEQEQNTEETIEPVGTGDNGGNETNNYYYNNDTYYVNGTDYLELISQVENLTVEVEELRLEIEEMNGMTYDPAEFSNITLKISYDDRAGYKEWRTINFSKMGNTVHMNASFDLPNDFELWFYDNTGSIIKYGQITTSYDQCYTGGNWTTSYSECSGNTSEIIYEFNLVREPVSVAQGQSVIIDTLESFP